jgi:hypothetical protein
MGCLADEGERILRAPACNMPTVNSYWPPPRRPGESETPPNLIMYGWRVILGNARMWLWLVEAVISHPPNFHNIWGNVCACQV